MSEAVPPIVAAAVDPLDAGRAALARHAWQEAYDQLSQADRDGQLSGADLEALSLAAKLMTPLTNRSVTGSMKKAIVQDIEDLRRFVETHH